MSSGAETACGRETGSRPPSGSTEAWAGAQLARGDGAEPRGGNGNGRTSAAPNALRVAHLGWVRTRLIAWSERSP